MSLKHTILAVLHHEPCTGYDISKTFEHAVGYFWQASHQQVYRELGVLTEQRLVTFSKINQRDKPDKKVYEITDRGKEELLRWLKKPIKPRTSNDELLVKIWSGELLGAQGLAQEIERQRTSHQRRLAGYLALEKEHFSPEPMSEASDFKRCQYMTLRKGIFAERAWIRWSKEMDEMLKLMKC